MLKIASDRTIKVWKVNELQSDMCDGSDGSEGALTLTKELKLHLYGVNDIKWSADGTILGSAGNDCNLNIIDITSEKVNRNFRIESPVTCLDFNYASNLVLAGTYDNQILLYDLRSKNVISHILAHSEPITSVSFSQDSTVLLSSSYDGFCRLWDTFKGICLKTIVLEKSPSIGSAFFLPDMNHLLISTLNNQIQVTELYKEEEVVKYTGHVNSNFLVDTHLFEFEGDAYLLSGSEDGSFYCWDVEKGHPTRVDVPLKTDNTESLSAGSELNCVNCVTANRGGLISASGFPDNNSIFIMKVYKD